MACLESVCVCKKMASSSRLLLSPPSRPVPSLILFPLPNVVPRPLANRGYSSRRHHPVQHTANASLLTSQVPSDLRRKLSPDARCSSRACYIYTACFLLFCGRGRRDTRAGFVAPAPRNSRFAFVPAAPSSSSLQGRVRCERGRERPLRRGVAVEGVVGAPSPLLGVVCSMLTYAC